MLNDLITVDCQFTHRRIYGYVLETSCFEAERAVSGMGSALGLGQRYELLIGVLGESGAFLALKSDIRW